MGDWLPEQRVDKATESEQEMQTSFPDDEEELMDEYSRIILEHYCSENRKRKLARLVRLSYDPGAGVTDADAIYLEVWIWD